MKNIILTILFLVGINLGVHAQYCNSIADSFMSHDITQVKITNSSTVLLNNTSSCFSLIGSQGTASGLANRYSNFTTSSLIPKPNLVKGSTYTLTIKFNSCLTQNANWGIRVAYFDWNQDGDFFDSLEEMTFDTFNSYDTLKTVAFIVPSFASNGNTRMRIVYRNWDVPLQFTSCGMVGYPYPTPINEMKGETEDYTINISNNSSSPDTVFKTPNCMTCPIFVCPINDDLSPGMVDSTKTCGAPLGYSENIDTVTGCLTYTPVSPFTFIVSSCIISYKNGISDTTIIFINNPCANKSLSLSKQWSGTIGSHLYIAANSNPYDSLATYIWKKNGVIISGANSSYIDKSATTTNDMGTYCVTVNYNNGCVKDTCIIITGTTTNPCNSKTFSLSTQWSGTLGSPLYLSANGNPYDSNATYVWKKNGVVISGATTSFIYKTSTTAIDTGEYCATITFSNGCTLDTCIFIGTTGSNPCAGKTLFITKQWSGTLGSVLTLYANSNPIDSNATYLWKKNGVALSGGTSPYVYKSNTTSNDTGNYCVIVTYSNGCVKDACMQISTNTGGSTISCSQYKYFTQTVSGNNVYFNTSSVPAPYTATYNWSFSNGQTSTVKNPSSTFANGTHTAYLVFCIKDSNNAIVCCDTTFSTFTVSNYTPISCNINANYGYSVNGSNYNFTDSTTASGFGLSYYWNFGDGTYSYQKNPVHTFTTNGVHTVTLLAYAWLNNSNQYCIDTMVKTIVVSNANICNSLITEFGWNQGFGGINFVNQTQQNGFTITNYNWSFGDGTTSTAINPTKTYTYSGSYVVTLSITAYDSISQTTCTKTRTKYVYFNSNPCYNIKAYSSYTKTGLNVSFNNYSTSGGMTPSYFWSFGNGTTSTQIHPTVTYTNPGIYRVVQKITVSQNGITCVDSNVKIIQVSLNNPCKDSGFVNGINSSTCGTYVSPVCGCDGITYQNYCYAYTNGVKQYTYGPCPNDTNYITICGYIYQDDNHNCSKDSAEIGIKYKKVAFNTTPISYAYTNNLGYYTKVVPRGNYILTQIIDTFYNPKYKQLCPAGAITVNAVSGTQVYCNNNFYDTTQYVCRDLQVGIHRIANITPGFTSMKRISYANNGSTPIANAVLKYKYSPVLTIKNTTSAPYTMLNNIITWNLGTLAPFASGNKYANFNTPTTGVAIGSLHYDTAWIEPADTNDCNLANNLAKYIDTCTSSWDPNDKAVSPSGNILPEEKELEFLVRFQNTGTAPAHNVVIKDPLDASIDVSSIVMLNTSHPATMHLRDDQSLHFEFENIMLPDSGTDYEGSQGFVSFKARLKNGLSLGTQIKNTAYIYFDFNEAVVTNTTINTVYKKSTSAIYPIAQDAEVKLYPNPLINGKTTLQVHSKTPKGVAYRIIDLSGRVLESSIMSLPTSTYQETLNLENYSNGIYFLEISINGERANLIRIVR